MLVRLQTHLNSFTIHALNLSHVRYRQSHGWVAVVVVGHSVVVR